MSAEYAAEITVDFVKERPILFKGEMVRAILKGCKTQTRRILKWQPLDVLPMNIPDAWITLDTREPEPHGKHIKCRLGKVGDRLWVRETYNPGLRPLESRANGYRGCVYRADDFTALYSGGWTPSIFMPRRHSRITLEITGVRCERLQNITEADAIAEGIELDKFASDGYWKNYEFTTAHPRRNEITTAEKHRIVGYKSPVDSYASLWRSINGADSWDANPFVWVIEFRKVTK